MIFCDFCDDFAAYAYPTRAVVWEGLPATLHFCRWHLTLYYLGLAAEWAD